MTDLQLQQAASSAFPARSRSALLWIGLALLIVGTLAMFRNPKNDPVPLPFALTGLGLACFFVGAAGLPLRDDQAAPLDESSAMLSVQPRDLRPIPALLGVGLIVFTTARCVQPTVYFWEQLATWIAGIVLLMVSVRGQGRLSRTRGRLISAGLCAGLVIAALFIHMLNLNNTPYLMDQDEALFAIDGVYVAQQNFLVSPFSTGFHSHPRLYQGLIGAFVEVFGQDFAGARLLSAIMGALGVGATFLLGEELFGRSVGVFAALFMLAWPFHVLFARLAMNQPADPVFTTLAFWALARGLRRGSSPDFVLAGVMFAIGQLFYLGGRLALPVAVAYLVFLLIRDRARVRAVWRGLLLTGIAFVLVALPQHFYLLNKGEPLTTRAYVSVVFGGRLDPNFERFVGTPVEQVYRSFAGLLTVPDPSWYGRGSSLMNFTGGALLLLGTVICLVALWKRPRYALPLGWAFSVILLGSVFSLEPPQYQRYYPGGSALALLVGIGGVGLASVSSGALKRPQERTGLTYSLAGLICLCNLLFLFLVYWPERGYFNNRANQLTNRLGWMVSEALDAGQQVVIIRNPLPRTVSEAQSITYSPEIFLSNGVDNTDVVKYLTRRRPYNVIETRLDPDAEMVDFSKPFAIFVPIFERDGLVRLYTRRPGGEPLFVNLQEDGQPAFFIYRSATGIAPMGRR